MKANHFQNFMKLLFCMMRATCFSTEEQESDNSPANRRSPGKGRKSFRRMEAQSGCNGRTLPKGKNGREIWVDPDACRALCAGPTIGGTPRRAALLEDNRLEHDAGARVRHGFSRA